MKRHFVIIRIYSCYEEIIGVVHFEKFANNIVEFLNNNFSGLHYFKEVKNHDLRSRFK